MQSVYFKKQSGPSLDQTSSVCFLGLNFLWFYSTWSCGVGAVNMLLTSLSCMCTSVIFWCHGEFCITKHRKDRNPSNWIGYPSIICTHICYSFFFQVFNFVQIGWCRRVDTLIKIWVHKVKYYSFRSDMIVVISLQVCTMLALLPRQTIPTGGSSKLSYFFRQNRLAISSISY